MAITSAAATSIASLYIGFYDRAPDPVGLNYWMGKLAEGVSLTDIAESFAASPEAAATYPYIKAPNLFTPEQMIDQVYNNIFGRDADDDGMAYYSARLEAGESVGSVLASIIGNAATNADGEFPDSGILANKVEVGLNWAETAGLSGVEIYKEDGASLNDAGKASAAGVIDGVDETAASVTEGNGETSDFFGGGGAGDSFILSDALGENVVGTSGADTFTAVVRGANPTLNVADQIDGGDGVDTLNLFLNAGAPADLPAGSSIENVEIVNLIATAAGRTMPASFDASQFVGATEVWQVNDAVDITGLGTGVTAGFRDTIVQAADTVTVADGVASASIALDGVSSGAVVGVNETTVGDLETISVSGSVAGAGSLTIDSNVGGVETVNLSLTSDGTVALQDFGAVLTTLNASGSTGDLTVNVSANAGLETASFGSGADNVTIGSQADLVVNLGAGADTISFDGSGEGQQINGGAGGDTFILTAAATNISETNDFADLVTKIDFSSPDVIDLSGTGFVALNDAQADAVATAAAASGATFADVFAVATAFQAETAFVFDGSTYYVNDDDASGTFTDGDGAVQLVGFTGDLVDGSNLIA